MLVILLLDSAATETGATRNTKQLRIALRPFSLVAKLWPTGSIPIRFRSS